MSSVRRRLFATPSRTPLAIRRVPAMDSTAQFRSLNRRTMKGPKTSGTLRQQLRSLQAVVKKLTPELKYLDTDVSVTNITTAGSVISLNGVPEGTTDATRTGRTINVNKIHIQGLWRSTTNQSAYRVAVVVDRQQVDDTDPTVGDVFSSTDPVDAMPDVNALERFRILKISPLYEGSRVSNTSGVPTQSSYFEFTWNGSIKVSFNGTAGTDIQKNGIYIILLSDDTGNTADFEGTARIGYTDA